MSQSVPVYLSVETLRSATDVGRWKPRELGLSVAVTLTGSKLRIFSEKKVDQLLSDLREAPCIIGYNLLDLDFQVLAGYGNVETAGKKCIDLMTDIEVQAGCRVFLSEVRAATLGQTDVSGFLSCVERWKQGEVEEVTESCCNDVLAMQAIHEFGRANDKIFYVGKESGCPVQVAVNW